MKTVGITVGLKEDLGTTENYIKSAEWLSFLQPDNSLVRQDYLIGSLEECAFLNQQQSPISLLSPVDQNPDPFCLSALLPSAEPEPNLFSLLLPTLPAFKERHLVSVSPSTLPAPTMKPNPKLIAVMMPFASDFSPVFETITKACEKSNLICHRADSTWANEEMFKDICNLIENARIIIIDFTGQNANVMIEVGVALGNKKRIIPITQNIKDIPSNLSSYRAIKYLANSQGLEKLKNDLAARIKTLYDGHTWRKP